MKTWSLLLIFVFANMLSSCLKTRSDLEEEKSSQEIQTHMNQLQRSAADQEVKFQDIDSELRSLSGRIEVIERKNQISSESDEQKQKSVGERIAKLEEVTKLLQDALTEQENQINQLKKTVVAQASRSKPKKTKKLGNYTGAERAFSRKEWKEAIIGYEKYLELNPTGKVAHLATYKIGVCFEELKMKEEAKTFYQLAIDKYPSSDGARRSKYRLKNLK